MTSGITLAGRLEAALLPSEELEVDEEPEQSTPERILDAATRRFAEVGITATTMSSIATEAGLSREWLYRHYSNKDAVLTAVVHRELRRFIDGLAASIEWNDDVVAMLTETFVYCVEFFRDLPVIESLVDRDITSSPDELRSRASALVAVATRSCSGYLVDPGGFDPQSAAVIAETFSRLIGSTLLVPSAELDLHDPAVLRDYAARIVPAVVRC